MSVERLDIHEYGKRYASAERLVRKSGLSGRNQAFILDYCEMCQVRNVCGSVRLIRVMGALVLFGRLVPLDFDQWRKLDVERLVKRLLDRVPAYSAETLATYKAILRRFLTWITHPDEFPNVQQLPAIVSWLRCHVKQRDKRPLQRKDLLFPSEIEASLRAARTSRDRALISLLWETGSRIAEVGNLRIDAITPHEHGFLIDVQGKTGHRTLLVVSSAPYLRAWLNEHPLSATPSAPLWIAYVRRTHLQYHALHGIITDVFAMTGLEKRLYPHLFRHSRATYVLATGLMNEAQAKAYFGWTPGSRMLAVYMHLSSEDANNAILRENNVAPQRENVVPPTVLTCFSCHERNPVTHQYCNRCGSILSEARAYDVQLRTVRRDQLLAALLSFATQPERLAATTDHLQAAGLGSVLGELSRTANETATPVPPYPGETRTVDGVKQDEATNSL